jgi:hypothetical protein
MRMRAIAEFALAVETGRDVDQAVNAAHVARVEPYEIAALGGLPMRGVLATLAARDLIRPGAQSMPTRPSSGGRWVSGVLVPSWGRRHNRPRCHPPDTTPSARSPEVTSPILPT